MSTPGIGAGGGPSPIRPPARPPAVEARAAAAAAAPAPATEAQVAQARDLLSSAGLDLRVGPGEAGTDLSALVDEVALDPSMGSLGRGSDPAAVSALQGTLNALGAEPPLSVDGAYGPRTTEAVRAFQEKLGLTADGVAGPNTIWALQAQEALALAAASPAGEAGPHLELAEALISELPEGQQATLRAQLAAAQAEAASEAASEAVSEAAPEASVQDAMNPGATGVAPEPMPEPAFEEDFNWNGDPAAEAAPAVEVAPEPDPMVAFQEDFGVDFAPASAMDPGATGVSTEPDPVVAAPAPEPMPETTFEENFNWNGDPAAEAAPEPLPPAEAPAPWGAESPGMTEGGMDISLM